MAMMRYFRQEQLLVFRSAILLAFVGPHLRGEACFVIIIVSWIQTASEDINMFVVHCFFLQRRSC